MTRSNRLHGLAASVVGGLALFLCLGGGRNVSAQTAPPCRPGDSLLSMGKAAFFKSIERGAFAIGERTLDDLLDGLGGPGAARSAGRPRHAGATTPAQARAAAFPPGADDALVAALSAYVESPSSEAADAALQVFLETATNIPFETPPEKPGESGRMGLVLEDRQFRNRSSVFAVSDLAQEGKRIDLEASLFGDGPDLGMGTTNALLRSAPFFKAPVIADTRNVDRNNLGIVVKKELDLRALWFEDYRVHLAAENPGTSPAQITEALNAGWPTLQKFWAFKRTEIFITRAQAIFGAELREVNERVTQGNLPLRGCESKRP